MASDQAKDRFDISRSQINAESHDEKAEENLEFPPSSSGIQLFRRASSSAESLSHQHILPFKYLLIDLSGIGFIDMAGVTLLKSLVQDYGGIGIKVLFAAPGGTVP